MPIGVHGLEVPWAVGKSSAAQQIPADEPTTFVCQLTKKKFKTKATYENWLTSKKYKELAAASAAKAASSGGKSADVKAPVRNPAAESGADDAVANALSDLDLSATASMVGDEIHGPTSLLVEATASIPAAAASSPPAAHGDKREGGDASGSDDDEDDEDDDGWEDAPFEPRWTESLFDAHVSASFEANAVYMRVAHSFFVPDLDHLADARGLFAYLQEKICRYHTCLYCQRAFVDVEACRSHMREKAHCKLDADSEVCALEICEFYDFGDATSADAADGATADAGDARDGDGSTGGTLSALRRVARVAAVMVDGDPRDGADLVLRNGRRLGHRTLRQYYRQSFGGRSMQTRFAALKHGVGGSADGVAAAWRRQRQQRREQQQAGGALGQARLQMQLALRREAKRRHGLLVRATAFSHGLHSKAIASTFQFKAGFADNKHARALQHHGYGGFGGGAHYTMAGSKQFQKGVRIKGVISRHSKQGARMQAARVTNRQNRGESSMAVKR